MIYVQMFDWVLDGFGCCSYVSTIITNIATWFCLTRPKVTEDLYISKDSNITVNLS